MTTYAAFLGNHPDLSLAELRSSVPDLRVKRMIDTTITLFETPADLTNTDLEHWGGIFLLARGIEGKHGINEIPQLLRDEVKDVRGKVTFSLRSFGVPRPAVHRLYRDVKNHLKEHGIPARYIGNEHKSPVSAQLHDEGLITGKEGCELVLLGNDEGELFWIGRTVAVQDPDSYTKRDMEKPVRDTRAGLLPPKLAQIMLNLGEWVARETSAGSKPKTRSSKLTVLDPFCGTGVIPMEALLRNWSVLASDASLKAVNGCEKNLDWMRKEWKILKRDVPSTVWKQDATKPFSLKDKPDAIVTETMLGPPLSDRPTSKDAQKFRSECDALEIAFLKNVSETLPGVPVVAMFPVWYVKTGMVRLEQVWKKLKDLGYEAVLPPGSPIVDPGRPSIVYRRAEQFVGREIVILKPLSKTETAK